MNERNQKEVNDALVKVAIFIASAALAKTGGDRDAALLLAVEISADFGKTMAGAVQGVIESTRSGDTAAGLDAIFASNVQGGGHE